ncbi:MAG: hypothetical protein KAV68_02675 [Dehalococcoidales bacterium]|nr:hypothetical protein [Dehalococcoidales bacterium]
MAKPKTSFIKAFEPILIKAWGSYQDNFDDNLLRKTREALSYIRRVYRFKGELGAESPTRIDFRESKNRAGYLAAFGERHAYLAYAHLKRVQAINPTVIPMPDAHGELTVTLVGAGPAIETYGLCLFYNESTHELKRLTLNLIEKVREWQPARELVISGLIKEVLPKVDIFSIPIEADIKEANCVQTFAAHHDSLVSTQILIIYNVLNEIESMYASVVLRNLSYIIRQCEQLLLVLLAEPTALNAWPRIKWIRELLLQYSTVLIDKLNEEIKFSEEPARIALTGLNERLFSRAIEKNPPVFETSLKRVILACQTVPPEPFSSQRYEQLRRLLLKRDRKGRIVKEPVTPVTDYQLPLFS